METASQKEMIVRRSAMAAAALLFLGLIICRATNAADAAGRDALAPLDAVKPGNLEVEPPTLICLGVRWTIGGDDNHNATVKVWYRQQGAKEWNEALPLLYVNPDGLTYVHRKKPDSTCRWEAGTVKTANVKYTRKVPTMFAGSIFDLKPNTEYEIKLKMEDPDGGGIEKIVKGKTRPVPVAPKDAKVVKCKPQDLQKIFDAASPGTIIQVGPGTFKGTLNVSTRKGTLEKPIVIRGAKGHKTILEGDGGNIVVNAHGAQHVYFESLVIRGPAKFCAIFCDKRAKGLVVRRCKIYAPSEGGHGIRNKHVGQPSSNFYIADNEFFGSRKWPEKAISQHIAVVINGRGHVICHNMFYSWGTAIQFADQRTTTLDNFDVYNNEIRGCAEPVEADGGTHNIRIFRNRITNCGYGISTQPIFGGPCYIFRNAIYDSISRHCVIKLHNAPYGVLYFHNTSIRLGSAFICDSGDPVRGFVMRNNLSLGGKDKTQRGRYAGGYAWVSFNQFFNPDMDYNGFNEGKVVFRISHEKRFRAFPTFRDFIAKNPFGLEKHGVIVDLSIFKKSIRFPDPRFPDPEDPESTKLSEPQDLRIKENCNAVDKGVVLPNINDGFTGEAPDLGAYELGDELPIYGPRPEAAAGDAAKPGRIVEELPTIRCLGVRWFIGGDKNKNAVVEVEYRKAGEKEWKQGLDLFRVERAGMRPAVRPPEGQVMLAGSIFKLDENTEYEVKLTLKDPDGGGTAKTLKMKTWREPELPKGKVVKVRPGGLKEAITGASPGDTLLLQKGVYQGTFSLKSGTPGKPIALVGAPEGGAILDGNGANIIRGANGIHDVMLENLSFRNASWSVVISGAARITIRRCTFSDVVYGISATKGANKQQRIFISDNVMTGLSKWPDPTRKTSKGRAVQVVGRGNVVCYNRISLFTDGIDTYQTYPNSAVDFYGNEISKCLDDAIEMDYSDVNTRCFENRITDVFVGISVQPIHGGPCYIFRNAMYDIIRTPLKMNNSPSGVLYIHNTTVRAGAAYLTYSQDPVRNLVWRNNLCLGSKGQGRWGPKGPQAWVNFNKFFNPDLDYDGFTQGKVTFTKTLKYPTFQDFMNKNPLGLEKHGTVVDISVFAKPIAFPDPTSTKLNEPQDLRLKKKCAAVDKGCILSSINDGYHGKAPDLGAYEAGDPLPHYGPRPE